MVIVAQPDIDPVKRDIEADIAAVQRISAVPTILNVISQITGLRLTLVARVTLNSWTACATLDRMAFGLNVGDRLEVTTTLCSEVRDSHLPIVIEHASTEPAFCDYPTPKMYKFESYVSFPLFRSNGDYFGTLCGLDSQPIRLRDEKTTSMLKLFAELISLQLIAEEDHERDRVALSEERRTAELREQFIAVLGHDLRTPLVSVVTGADLLLTGNKVAGESRNIIENMRSSGKRIARMVDDLMDFTRGRLGDGIPVDREAVDNVDDIARHVVAEVASVSPHRTIRLQAMNAGPALVDRARLAQMMSNLVMNALQHSPQSEPVEVRIERSEKVIRFEVVNRGAPIPPHQIDRIFEPFYRGDTSRRQGEGLGLGLFIAAHIVRAHGGRIECASSSEEGTRFTATLPQPAPS